MWRFITFWMPYLGSFSYSVGLFCLTYELGLYVWKTPQCVIRRFISVIVDEVVG